MNQRIRTQISCWFSIFGLALLFSASGTVLAQGLRSDGDLGAQWRVNSTARLLAGLAPWHPAHLDFAKTDAWKEHSSAMQGAWGQLTANRIKPMASWREATIQSPCPAGKTLLYPFSGPDFFNAYWLFPDCDSYVMFGLEHIGELPTIENMNEKQVAKLVADVRTATSDLFDRNYFITENMARQLHTSQLRGVIPLLAIEMALSGMDILRIVPYEIGNAMNLPVSVDGAVVATGTAEGDGEILGKQRPLRPLKSVAIDFRVGDSGKVKRVIYFSIDATDGGLADRKSTRLNSSH